MTASFRSHSVVRLQALPSKQNARTRKLVFWVLTALLLSLSFRAWSFTDGFEFRAYSPAFEALRPIGFIISGSLLILFIGLLFYLLPAGTIKPTFGPMHLLLLLTLVIKIKAYTLGESASNYPESLLLSCCLILAFGFLLPSALRTYVTSFDTIIGALFASGIIWAALSMREWQINPSVVIWYERFHGISGHPNHAGVITAIAATAGLGLFFKFKPKWQKFMILVGVICLTLLTLWTGSRTAMLVECVGFTCVLFTRGKALLTVSTVTIILISLILTDAGVETDVGSQYRTLSSENTRIAVWEKMWSEFSNNWFLGGDMNNSSTENSFLLVLSTTGIIGGTLFFGAMFLVMIHAYNLLGITTPELSRPSEKAAGAILTALFVGAIFEGNLRAEFSYPVFAIYILTAGVSGRNYHARPAGSPSRPRQIASTHAFQRSSF